MIVSETFPNGVVQHCQYDVLRDKYMYRWDFNDKSVSNEEFTEYVNAARVESMRDEAIKILMDMGE